MTLNSINYHTKVTLSDGTVKKIIFSPITYNGARGDCVFCTEDEEIIKAIKSHRKFGDIIVVKSEKELKSTTQKVEEIDLYSLLPDKEVAVIDKTVVSAKSAKVWLQANLPDVEIPSNASKADIKRIAAENNVIFEGWN